MYVTTPDERLMVKPCGFTNTAAATGTYTTTAVKYDPRGNMSPVFGTNEVRRFSKTFFLGGVASLAGLKNSGFQVAT